MEKQGYEIIRVGEGAWRIEDGGVRCCLFVGQERAMLTDTGFGTGDLAAEVAKLTDLPVTLVITHADRDHTGCNAQFAVAHMHPAEYDRYQSGGPLPTPVAPLWEGDVIDLGGRRFEVIHIPGHTPGSIALLDEANGVLVSGDSIPSGGFFMFGPGRNLTAYLHSMRRLQGYRGRFDTVYPSHGTFPLRADALDALIEGARGILAGEVGGEETTMRDRKIISYAVGEVKFLCDP